MPYDPAATLYDPHNAPDPQAWLALDEAERILMVSKYHADAHANVPRSNRQVHAATHATVENQLAEGVPEVRDALERLMSQGLDRHDAVHAISSVLIGAMQDGVAGKNADASPMEGYLKEVRELTADGWRKGA